MRAGIYDNDLKGSFSNVGLVSLKGKKFNSKNISSGVRESIELLGGIYQFIKKGQNVLIKPNFVAPISSKNGVTVDPVIVTTIVEISYEAGARH